MNCKDAAILMVYETRLLLNKAIDELMESFTQFDKNKVTHLTIGLGAIYHAQKNIAPDKKTNLYSVCDYDLLHHLLEKNGITLSEFEKIPHLLQSKEITPEQLATLSLPLRGALLSVGNKNGLHYEVPTPAMVAVMFNIVNYKIKDALIASQAGERILRATERAATVSRIPIMKVIAFRDTLYDFGNEKRLARSYIGNSGKEPDYLVSAKATSHLADLFESSLRLHPSLCKMESTAQSIDDFTKLAANILKHAAENLSMTCTPGTFEPNAVEKLKELANHVGKQHIDSNKKTVFNSIEKGMNVLMEVMRADGVINDEESQDFKELVEKRVEQIKKMEPVH